MEIESPELRKPKSIGYGKGAYSRNLRSIAEMRESQDLDHFFNE